MTLNIQIDNGQTFIDIQPMLAQFNDAAQSTQLVITSVQDNNYDTAIIYYELRSAEIKQISAAITNVVIVAGADPVIYAREEYKMQGSEYAAWRASTDSAYPFQALLAAYPQLIAI